MRKLIFFSVPIFVIGLFFYLYNYKEDSSVINQTALISLSEIDNSYVTVEMIERALDKSYYHEQSVPVFSSIGLSYPNPDPYKTYWMLRLCNAIDMPEKVECFSKVETISDMIIQGVHHDILYIRYQSGIQKILGNTMMTNIWINTLNEYFDNEDSLYYSQSKSDNINKKINTTLIVLDAIKDMGEVSTKKNEITEKAIQLFNDDTFFNLESVDNAVLFNGGSIVVLLKKLGYEEMDLEGKIPDRSEWLNNINRDATEFLTKDNINSFFFLRTLIDINDFFGKKTSISPDIVRAMNDQYRDFLLNEFQIFEPQFETIIAEVNNYFNISDHNQTNQDIIRYSIPNGLNKVGTTQLNFKDNYYGILLANLIGYEFHRDRLSKHYTEVYEQYFLEDSNIGDKNKLYKLYYMLLTSKELSIDVSNTKKIINSVNRYIVEYTEENGPDSLGVYSVCMKILEEINGDLTQEAKRKIQKLLYRLDEEGNVYKSNLVTQYQYLVDLISTENEKIINEKINSAIQDLKDKSGLYKKNVFSNQLDIATTYEIVLKKSTTNELTLEECEKILRSLRNIIKYDALTGVNLKEYFVDLETIYYSVMLCELLKDQSIMLTED
ncbi:hypothetical protein [Marinicrinis sediminis]|uniref:Uncharacterized protein n=1 Tax=Marinicrinis sediminis TaxID=1652465 RepID=A0ABW5R8U4_9BACL